MGNLNLEKDSPIIIPWEDINKDKDNNFEERRRKERRIPYKDDKENIKKKEDNRGVTIIKIR